MLARFFFLVLSISFFAFPNSSNAARFSGDYLIHVCGSDAQGKELAPGGHVACQAYISGVMDYHNLIQSLGTSPSVDFCVPKGITLNEIQNEVVQYLLENKDEHGNFIASPGVALALYSRYPCKKSKTK